MFRFYLENKVEVDEALLLLYNIVYRIIHASGVQRSVHFGVQHKRRVVLI